jgi:hypothetical protein
MVAVTGALLVLVEVNEPILPVPLAAKPIEGVLLTQLNTTLLPPLPLLGLVKVIAFVFAPLHNTSLSTAFTVAVGLTVMLKVVGVPTQLTAPLVKVGVTVMVATIGAVVALVAIKVGILPVPDAAIPIEGALLVQLYVTVPPVAGLLKLMAAVEEPLHNTWLATEFTVAVGLTEMVNEMGAPVHATPALVYIGVTVIVAVISTD